MIQMKEITTRMGLGNVVSFEVITRKQNRLNPISVHGVDKLATLNGGRIFDWIP